MSDLIEQAIAAIEPLTLTLGSTGRKVNLPNDLTLVEVADLAAFFSQSVNQLIQQAAARNAPDTSGLSKRGFVVAGR